MSKANGIENGYLTPPLANSLRSAYAVKVALSDPAVLAVARSLMDQAVSQ